MIKRGLFGGTFDPIHNGHIEMALRLKEQLGLDSVVLMPTFVPPHKLKEHMAPAHHRLAMCRLAVQAHPGLTVSELELQRQGASFTVDTLEELQRQEPDTQWYLFTGADMFCTLRTWYRFADIARMAVLCTVPREGTDTASLRAYAASLEAEGVACYVDAQPVQTVSSTRVRELLAAGEGLSGLVPEAVEQYIHLHGLYTGGVMDHRTRDEQFTAIIRARLGDHRFHHSLCVAEEAARLAKKYGADPQRAYTAGLLHDIMKDTDAKSQLKILADFAILLSEAEQSSPALWHARTGEVFLRHILGVTEEDILQAVRYHTTGRAGMSLLERVLFVADFTSADRDYPDIGEIRRLAEISLEQAMLYGMDYTIRDLLKNGRTIHPDTVAAYNDIVLSEKRRANE